MSNIEVKLVEAQISTLSLAKGDTLVVKVISDDADTEFLRNLKESLSQRFPDNKVLLLFLPSDSNITFEKIVAEETSSCVSGQFCDDCTCGKKESSS